VCVCVCVVCVCVCLDHVTNVMHLANFDLIQFKVFGAPNGRKLPFCEVTRELLSLCYIVIMVLLWWYLMLIVHCIVTQCPDSAQVSLQAHLSEGSVQRPRDDFVGLSDSSAGSCDLSETALVRLHRRVIVSVEQHNSTQCQWNKLIENAVYLEDVRYNQSSGSHLFVRPVEVGCKSIWNCCRCPRFG